MEFMDSEYEEMACIAIRNYLNKGFTNDFIKENYSLAVKRMMYKAKQSQEGKPPGVKSITEGDTSVSFDNTVDILVVDNEIKALLPSPYIKMY